EGIVERIEWDPFRSANIALIRYPQSKRIQYQLAVHGLKPAIKIIIIIIIKPRFFRPGVSTTLRHVPDKAVICNIEFQPGGGGKLCRAAGTSAKIVNKDATRKGYALLQLPNGELRLFNLNCLATLGRISNVWWNKINWGKAGNRRNLGTGWRPAVRGLAMNSCKHPHGGGSGNKRTRPAGGGGFVTKWGVPQGGFRTKPKHKLRVPVERQMIMQMRPRNFKKGQLF
ncbi:hypothetical protein RFI_21529, partial [Reticulomyxa filosa]